MSTTEPPGPALACPGCGSPDVNLGRGLLCRTCAETAAGISAAAGVLARVALPPPVADYGPVRLEIAGQ